MRDIPYAAQWIDKQDIKAVQKVLRSAYLTQGPMVEAFEKAMASYCGAKYAVAVNSGTSALHIACLAAGITKGDEVITSPITFVASANSVLYCGAKPIFADVKADTVTIDPAEIKKKITNKTKAIIPVDFAGQPANLKQIRKIADAQDLVIIEDAAHALGAKYYGERIGSCNYSDMTILSFHAVKHITTGEGGIVLTNRNEFYERLLIFRSHGVIRDNRLTKGNHGPWYYEMQELGFNYRITDLQCALGISQLKKLSRFIKRRKRIAARYNNVFSKYDELNPLKEEAHVDSARHLYVLRFNLGEFSVSRKRIFEEYRNSGIQVNVHYIPVYYQPYYQGLGYKKGLCPRAEKYYEEAITLPLYPKMTDLDINRVIDVTMKIVMKFRKKNEK